MTDAHIEQAFLYEPSEAHPGWHLWRLRDRNRFNTQFGDLLLRIESGPIARIRMAPHQALTNANNNIHGGALLGFLDISLFAGAHHLGATVMMSAVTLDLQAHFVSAGIPDQPVDAIVELVRETGSLVFLRGTMVQGEDDAHVVLSFTGMMKKVRAKKA